MIDLGYLLHRRGDDEGAINNFEIARQLNPTNPFVYHDLGRLLRKTRRNPPCPTMYRRAVEVGPDSRAGRASQRRIAALRGTVGPNWLQGRAWFGDPAVLTLNAVVTVACLPQPFVG